MDPHEKRRQEIKEMNRKRREAEALKAMAEEAEGNPGEWQTFEEVNEDLNLSGVPDDDLPADLPAE